MAGSCGVVSAEHHITHIRQIPRSSPSPGAESWKNPGCPSDVPRWTERRKLGSSQMQICNRNWCCLFWTSHRYTKILFDCKPLWEILRTLNIFNSGQKDFLPMEGFDRGFAELFPPRRRNSCRKPGRCLRPKCGSTQNLWTVFPKKRFFDIVTNVTNQRTINENNGWMAEISLATTISGHSADRVSGRSCAFTRTE